jgi:hypothetical protein
MRATRLWHREITSSRHIHPGDAVRQMKREMAGQLAEVAGGRDAFARLKVENAIRTHLSAGHGILKVARLVGVGSGTVQRVSAAPWCRCVLRSGRFGLDLGLITLAMRSDGVPMNVPRHSAAAGQTCRMLECASTRAHCDNPTS